MNSIRDLQSKKLSGVKSTMVTCYDFTFARILNSTSIDCILVGDSAAMVMHGHRDTLSATSDLMALHTRAVVRGAPNKLIVADVPFLAFRGTRDRNLDGVAKLMRAGANAVKIEGAKGQLKEISHLVESGVPVMGHLGLTPQSVHQLGGYKVQGKTNTEFETILQQSQDLEAAGCFAIVLECVPSSLGRKVASTLSIPVIGIGAGPDVDGQVLVLQDLLGLQNEIKPQFVRRYLDGSQYVTEALQSFHQDVLSGKFPSTKESYK